MGLKKKLLLIMTGKQLSILLRTDAIVLKLHTAGRSSSEHPGSSVEDNSDRSAAFWEELRERVSSTRSLRPASHLPSGWL